MKKHILILGYIIFVALSATAQTATIITGIVKDASGVGLLAVNVAILKPTDTSLLKADITDNDGKYHLQMPTGGNYLLRFSSIGYATVFAGPFQVVAGSEFNAPQIVLPVAASQLKAVTVTSKKPLVEVKADKVVFNVENSINATGSNAMELLQKSPGITVDNNDNISMKGKTGVKVYIDGKMTQLDTKDLASYLKSINSNDVEAIEMISNPSAKYDASGNAGIVNLRLKKNKKYGTNGSTNINFIQGVTPKTNGSINLNYRNNKVNVFGNVGGDIGQRENGLNLDRFQNDTSYIQRSINRNNEQSINMKGGLDFFVNTKSTLGILVTTNVSNNTWTSAGNTEIFDKNGLFIKKLLATNEVPGSHTNNNLNFNYKYTDTNGRELNIDADYGLFRGRGKSLQPNYYVGSNNQPIYTVINRNYTPTNIDIYTFKADWEQRLGKGKLGFGAKTAYVVTNNTFNFYNVINNQDVKLLDRSNDFKYTENVNAAYVNYSRALNTKVSIQTGLRMENTASKGELQRADGKQQPDDTVVRNYTDLFPSAALTWNINQKHSLNLTFSRRIDRPTYQDLNPFENKLDELSYEKGNAFLRPQYTQTVELTHTFMGFINTTVGYSKVKDFATQITDTIRNASYVQQRNLATQTMGSFNIGAPLPIAKWWTGYVNLWYNYQVFEGKIGVNAVRRDIQSYGAYMQQTFTIGKQYSAELSGWFNGPSVWGATWQTKSQGGLDIGVQKQFWDKKASLKASITDLFYTAPWRATTNFGGLSVNGNGNWESRTLRLSFSYRFGSSQISKSRERATGMESEGGRIKGK